MPVAASIRIITAQVTRVERGAKSWALRRVGNLIFAGSTAEGTTGTVRVLAGRRTSAGRKARCAVLVERRASGLAAVCRVGNFI